MLNLNFSYRCAEYRYNECCYAKCPYAECCYTCIMAPSSAVQARNDNCRSYKEHNSAFVYYTIHSP
jgi:hypothetical protein